MSTSSSVPVTRLRQVEPVNNPLRSEVEPVTNNARKAFVAFSATAEGVDSHRNRLRNANRVGQLYLRFFCGSGLD